MPYRIGITMNPDTAAAPLLTFGLSDDWSFEKDFLRRRPVPLASYDPTLTEAHLLCKSLKYLVNTFVKWQTATTR